MLQISIFALVAFIFILGFVMWKYRACFKCTLAAMTIFSAVLYFTNALYTWFVNLDSADADRDMAIVVAVCNPRPSSSLETRDVSCGSRKMIYGFDIDISSKRVLTQKEIGEMIARVRKLKPIITNGRIHMTFKKWRIANEALGTQQNGMHTRSFSYGYSIYETADI